MLFNFCLKPPLECAFPGDYQKNERHVCWFYLTDSQYYINLGNVKLFEHSPQWCKKYQDEYPENYQFVDYQYSRQLEDLFEILPKISCPMPERLYSLIDTEEKRERLFHRTLDIWDVLSTPEHREIDELFDDIVENLTGYGRLDSGYLRFRSDCQFFHVNDRVIIRYNFLDTDEDGDSVWSAGAGSHTIPYTAFVEEIESLCNRFFTAMDKQVEAALEVFTQKELQNSNLTAEHARRKAYFYGVLNSMKSQAYEHLIDWEKIEKTLAAYVNNAIE